MILRKFHYKRRRFPMERFRFLEHNRCEKNATDSHKVNRRSNPRTESARSRNHASHARNHRKLCTARHPSRRHNRQTAIVIIFNRLRRHNTRDAAARRNQKRDKAFARKTKATENAVHHKCDAHHISAIFDKGKQNKEHKHLRSKPDDGSHATDYAIHQSID